MSWFKKRSKTEKTIDISSSDELIQARNIRQYLVETYEENKELKTLIEKAQNATNDTTRELEAFKVIAAEQQSQTRQKNSELLREVEKLKSLENENISLRDKILTLEKEMTKLKVKNKEEIETVVSTKNEEIEEMEKKLLFDITKFKSLIENYKGQLSKYRVLQIISENERAVENGK